MVYVVCTALLPGIRYLPAMIRRGIRRAANDYRSIGTRRLHGPLLCLRDALGLGFTLARSRASALNRKVSKVGVGNLGGLVGGNNGVLSDSDEGSVIEGRDGTVRVEKREGTQSR